MPEIRFIFQPVLFLLLLPALSIAGAETSAGSPGGDASAAVRKHLSTLPYLSGYTPAQEKTGVILKNKKRSRGGLNFYISGHSPAAYLMDMNGRTVHTWTYDPAKLWPKRLRMDHWRKAYLFDNGDILAVCEGGGGGLIKLDRDSNLIWKYRGEDPHGGPHHDLDIAADGRIWLLTSRRVTDLDYKDLELRGPIMEDYITVLNGDGEEIKSFSVIDAFLNSGCKSVLDNMRTAGDIFHTNTIEILRGPGLRKIPGFKTGMLLISIPHLDTIAVIDPEKEEAVWALSAGWEAQHEPILLDNGNILLFDNKGDEGTSRVIEIEPGSGAVVWSYRGDPPEDFYSKTCGAARRLPDGNTMIVDTEAGRAFEVTPEGEIVWDFINPHRAGKDNELTASLFDLIRLENEPDFLKEEE